MTIAEIRDIQTPDLVKKVSELKQELFALRFQQGSGQMKQQDSGKMREIKKTIARILTVIKERENSK
jgi:large subunit ribosomal protein L29